MPAICGAWVLAAIAATMGFVACSAPRPEALNRYEFTRAEMGMPFRIVLYARTRQTAESAANAAFDRIRELNAIFSDYEEESELSRLSRTAGEGRAVPLSPPLGEILLRAQDLARRSGGAFDVTVGPYVSLWRWARRHHELPRPDLLAKARTAVGYQNLVLDRRGQTAQLRVPRMRLDLGGIAKGYAIDAALAVLRRKGVSSALVLGSGDMAASGPPPGRSGWRITLPNLETPNAPAERVWLVRGALATSGDQFQFVEIEGRRYSHIVDPRTGYGLTDHSVVVILARDATTADSLATTVSVLGPDAGLRLLESMPGVEARVARKPAGHVEVSETPGFRRHLIPFSTPPPLSAE